MMAHATIRGRVVMSSSRNPGLRPRPAALHRIGRWPAQTCAGTVFETPAHPSFPQFKALPPLALYVHIPWCVRKCPYCNFNSHEARGAVPEERYVAALIADLERALPQVWG